MIQCLTWFRWLTTASVAIVFFLDLGPARAVSMHCRLFFALPQNSQSRVPAYAPGFLPISVGQSPQDRAELPALLSSIANESTRLFLEARGLAEVLHWALVHRREHFHRVHFPGVPIGTRVLRYPEWRLFTSSSHKVVLGRLDDSSTEARERARLMVALRPALISGRRGVEQVIAEPRHPSQNPPVRPFSLPLADRFIGGAMATVSNQDLAVSIEYPEDAAASIIMDDATRRASFVLNVPGTPKSEFAAALHAYLNAFPMYQESVPLGLAVFAGLYAAVYGELMPVPKHLDVYAVGLSRYDFIGRYLSGTL